MSAEPPIVIVLSIIFGVLFYGTLMVVGVLMIRDTIRRRGKWGCNFKQAICTQCDTPMPRAFRKPTSWRQAMWGGWTCSECGFELDKWGRPIEKQNTLAKWAILRTAEDVEEDEQRPRRRDERIRDGNEQTQRGDAL
jgi:hypothetical protein